MSTKLAPFAPMGQYAGLHLSAKNATALRAPSNVVQVNTTTATVIAGGGAATVVTPASMAGINIGTILQIYGGTGTAEEVMVTAVTPTTFTANFANAHSGTNTLVDRGKGHWLGSVIVGAVGTAMTLTLYNGNPAMTYTSTPFGVGVLGILTLAAGAPQVFNIDCDYDLYYVYNGTTAGDVTITFLPKP